MRLSLKVLRGARNIVTAPKRMKRVSALFTRAAARENFVRTTASRINLPYSAGARAGLVDTFERLQRRQGRLLKMKNRIWRNVRNVKNAKIGIAGVGVGAGSYGVARYRRKEA